MRHVENMPDNHENSAYLFPELWDPDFEESLQGHAPINKAGRGNLVPYKTRVFPKSGGTPYTTTRWRKPDAVTGGSHLHVVPAAAYQGNLSDIYSFWQTFLGQQDEVTDEMMRPLVAMQEILFKGHAGLLVIQDNRVLGLATIQQGNDMMAASPLDQLRGNEKHIIDTLKEGLSAYEMN